MKDWDWDLLIITILFDLISLELMMTWCVVQALEEELAQKLAKMADKTHDEL